MQPNDFMFKVTNHKFVLKYTRSTTIGDVGKHDISLKVNVLTPFADIISGKWQRNVLCGIHINLCSLLIQFWMLVFITFSLFSAYTFALFRCAWCPRRHRLHTIARLRKKTSDQHGFKRFGVRLYHWTPIGFLLLLVYMGKLRNEVFRIQAEKAWP